MTDSSVKTVVVLNRWVEEYLAWMKQSGFAPSTIYIHERLLGHFKRFAEDRALSIRELFTYDALIDFEKCCGRLYASWTLKGLARYLAQRGLIPSAIKRPSVRLPDIYEEYLEFLKENGQAIPLTLATIRRILTALYEYLTASSVALPELRIEHIDEFLSRRNPAVGGAMATRRKSRTYLRGFLRYLYHNRDILERDLSKFVVGAVDFAHATPPKFLRREEIKSVFAMPKTYDSWELRCLAMVHLAYSLGLRPKEISLITLDDVFFQEEIIRLSERKANNPVTLPLPETAIKAIAAYVVGVRPKNESRRLFLTLTVPFRPIAAASVSRDVTVFLRKVNPNASAYWLRHTYAQHLLESNASIFEIKDLMGHDSLNSTRKYLQIHISLMRKVLFDEDI